MPVNPSYYSPAHFRIFYKYTKDARWLDLVDTTYYLLNTLSKQFDGQIGVGLVPDWCSVDNFDNFHPLKGKNSGFGYDAIRVPFRVALDFIWFQSDQSKKFLIVFADFIERQLQENNDIFCEYTYAGRRKKTKHNPLFYACYYCAMSVKNFTNADTLLEKNRSYIKKYNDNWIYLNESEYYSNSLAWLADGFRANVIKNLFN